MSRPPLTVVPEPFDSPDALRLCAALRHELEERYGGDEEPGEKPGVADVAAFLVARDAAGAAVACGGLRALDGHTVEIKRMYVDPDARGRGAGTLVLAALEEEARRRGFTTLRLETGTLQPDARALYERAGYHEIPCFGAYAGASLSRCYERRL